MLDAAPGLVDVPAWSDRGPAVAVAATFACDPLIPLLRDALLDVGATRGVAAIPYGEVADQLLSDDSLFATNTGGLNVCLIRIEDWSGPHEHVEDQVEGFVLVVRSFTAAIPGPMVIALCPEPPASANRAYTDRIVSGLRDLPDLTIIHVTDLLDTYEPEEIFAPDLPVPYTDEAFGVLAAELAQASVLIGHHS